MTSIAVIKEVMQFDKVKVNNICIYELEPIISRADSRSTCIYEVDPNMCRENTRTRNCGRTSNRKNKNMYRTTTTTVAPDLGSVSSVAMSWRRLSTSGK